MTDRAVWLNSVADEYMATGRLPLASGEVTRIYAHVYPEPGDAAAPTWKPREIRFSATFKGGHVIVTSRPLVPW